METLRGLLALLCALLAAAQDQPNRNKLAGKFAKKVYRKSFYYIVFMVLRCTQT